MNEDEIQRLTSQSGLDTTRQWVTAFSVARGPGVVILVGKEFITLNANVAPQDRHRVDRNVASWVMPEQSAIALRDALLNNFPLEKRNADDKPAV